jgi:hypothetical protein
MQAAHWAKIAETDQFKTSEREIEMMAMVISCSDMTNEIFIVILIKWNIINHIENEEKHDE